MDKVEQCPTCGAIKCPSCGAPLKEGITSCPYCGVEFRISEDKTTFLKVERLVCPYCGAKISRIDPFCPSCGKKAWNYCPNLDCKERFGLKTQTCPVCGMEVESAKRRLIDSYENLRESDSPKSEELSKELDPEENVLVLLNAVEDTLIITDSRLIHRSGKNYFTYPFSEIENASLDKFGNLIISLGGEKPSEVMIICPEKKEKQFQEAIDLLLKLSKRARE
ncbi:MAG: zinc ribbon domain-containing protein [Caldiserica bacterium]|jgi:uncharacterized Zn finger protein (UPF0148 family)|nr:zinc ribbon domain-containing protein [Caldisericota bacterium]MDH7563039.1 zinc ribbon domain-containing protein [Caldisericota bacterium]